MTDFTLHPRLREDCIYLGRLPICHVLLMNNANVPWFILVPESLSGVAVTELIDLPLSEQQQVLEDLNCVSAYVKSLPSVTKLNTAALGNVVPQLHIHIVGRNPEDYCWPALVWASEPGQPYADDAVESLRGQFTETMSGVLISNDG